MYCLSPVVLDNRGNLRALGVSAVVGMVNVKNLFVIHIKTSMEERELIAVNRKLRELFGPDTLVFTSPDEINFLNIREMSDEETSKWEKKSGRLIIKDEVIEENLLLEEEELPKEV